MGDEGSGITASDSDSASPPALHFADGYCGEAHCSCCSIDTPETCYCTAGAAAAEPIASASVASLLLPKPMEAAVLMTISSTATQDRVEQLSHDNGNIPASAWLAAGRELSPSPSA